MARICKRPPVAQQLDFWKPTEPNPMRITINLRCAGKAKPKAANMNRRMKRCDEANPFIAWAEARVSLSAQCRQVLQTLAKAVDATGTAIFSLRGLADASGLPLHRIRKVIDDLLNASVLALRMEEDPDGDGRIIGFAFRLARNSDELRSAIGEGFWLSRSQAKIEFRPAKRPAEHYQKEKPTDSLNWIRWSRGVSMSKTSKPVFCVIATYADDEGMCVLDDQELVIGLDLPAKSFRPKIEELCEAGLLSKSQHSDGTLSQYQLIWRNTENRTDGDAVRASCR